MLVPLVLVGAVEAAWGVLALARPVPAPRSALACSAVLTAGFVVVLLAPEAAHHGGGGGGPLPLAALGGAGALDLAVAVLLAIRLRRGSGRREDGAFRSLLGTAVAAAVVAVVTTTSLAGTTVGQHVH